MKYKRLISFILPCVAFMAVFAACRTRDDDPLEEFLPELAGTSWMLTSMDGVPNPEAYEITLAFEVEDISGQSGCNAYGGSYASTESTISFSVIKATEQACTEPEGIMQAEADYLTALQSVTGYALAGDQLTLSGSGGQVLVYTGSDLVE